MEGVVLLAALWLANPGSPQRSQKYDSFHGALEDVCLADAPPCAAAREYAKPLPEECAQTCRPCEGMDAAVRGAAGAGACSAALRPYRCSSPQCREGYVPKWLRQRNYSAQYARAYAVSALPHRAALRAANVTADRVAVLEGQPRLWGSRVSGARLAALAALSSRGHAALRFVVGLRDPFELMFSLWSFLYTLGRMPGRVEPTVGRALAHVRGCNATLFAAPARVLRTPEAELAEYHHCVREGKAAERSNSFLVHDSLYALNFLAWLPHFRGDLNEHDARHVSILSKIALLGPSSAPWESNTLLCDEDLAVARLLLEAGAQIVPPHDGPPLTSHTSDDCLSPLSIVRDVRVLDLLLERGRCCGGRLSSGPARAAVEDLASSAQRISINSALDLRQKADTPARPMDEPAVDGATDFVATPRGPATLRGLD